MFPKLWLIIMYCYALFTDLPRPIAVYPMNAGSGVQEGISDRYSSFLKGKIPSIVLQPGPYNDRNGSIFLNGSSASFISIPNRGYLNTQFSFTIALWIFQEESTSGTIICYKDGLELSLSDTKHLVAKFVFKRYKSETLKIFGFQDGVWHYVGFSYDYMTGTAKVWIGNATVSRDVGEQKELATSKELRVGASFTNDTRYFIGRISGLRIYDYALPHKEIAKSSNDKVKKGAFKN